MLQADSHQLRLRGYGSLLLPTLLLLWGIYCLSLYGQVIIPLGKGSIPMTPVLSWTLCAVCLLVITSLILLLQPWQKAPSAATKKRLAWIPILDIIFGLLVALLFYLAVFQ